MNETQFDYQKTPYSDIAAPYISIRLADPFGEKILELDALLDTGYDSTMLIPYDAFESLQLHRYQYPSGLNAVGELVTGERVELIATEAYVEIVGLKGEFITKVDVLKGCNEVLIGRELINSLIVLLNGPEETVKISSQLR